MKTNIDTMREALEMALRNYQQEMAYAGLPDSPCDKYRKALAALSTIDPDAIKREALRKVRAGIMDCHSEIAYDNYEEGYKDGTENALAVIDAAILGTEPAREVTK